MKLETSIEQGEGGVIVLKKSNINTTANDFSFLLQYECFLNNNGNEKLLTRSFMAAGSEQHHPAEQLITFHDKTLHFRIAISLTTTALKSFPFYFIFFFIPSHELRYRRI